MKNYLIVKNNIIQNSIISEDISEIKVDSESTIVDASSFNRVPPRFDYYLTESNTHVKRDVILSFKNEIPSITSTGSVDVELSYDGNEYNITDWEFKIDENRDLAPTNISNKVFSSSGSSFTLNIDDEILSMLSVMMVEPVPGSFVNSTYNVTQYVLPIQIPKGE